MSKVEIKEKKRGRPKKMNSTTPTVHTAHVAPAAPASMAPKPAAPAPVNEVPSGIRRDAPQANYFILRNGKPVKNVKELADLMDTMDDQVFNHHVRTEHNDFSAWIKDVFKDADLAEKLKTAKDKKSFQLVIYKHIANKLW